MSDAIEQLLPHRAPMRFIRELIECTDTMAIATARFTEKDFPVHENAVLESALVECVAQTVAAALGKRAQAAGDKESDHGMLVAISGFKIVSRPPIGKELRIETREIKRLGLMLLVSGKIFCDGQTVAAGELTLYA